MVLNSKKTKLMMINFSKNKQFTSRIKLNNQQVEVVDEAKILGTIVTKTLNWGKNTTNIIRRANARMQLLTKISSFGTSREELINVYNLFVRSLLEQCSVVWGSSLTKEQRINIERVKKTAVKIINKNKNMNYKKSLSLLSMKSLEERRADLSLNFAKKCLKNEKTANYFPLKKVNHGKNLRIKEKYHITPAIKERYKKISYTNNAATTK